MGIAEEYVKLGYFWLPSDPERKVQGTLRVVDGGNIELEILGIFDKNPASYKEMELPLILGHFGGNDVVTLYDCFYRKKSFPLGQISKSILVVNRALLGKHYEEDEDVIFDTFRFSVEGLDEWLNISGINVERDWDSKTASITYTPPVEDCLTLKNGMHLKFIFMWTPPGFPTIKEASITQKAFIELRSDDPRPLADFISVAYEITSLLCFAIDEIVSIRDVTATTRRFQREIGEHKAVPIPIKVLYPSQPFSKTEPEANRGSMLFRFAEIRENAHEIFNKWLDAYQVFGTSLNLYFASKTGAHRFIDGTFLSLAHCMETFHRRTSDETLMTENEYNELRSRLLEKCPAERQEWLRGILVYGNEINLRKRLKRIFVPFKKYLGGTSERSRIINSIVDTRNYFTHYSKELKTKAASGKDLWLLCLKMEAILQLHFLKELGFTDKQIEECVSRCFRLQQKINHSSRKDTGGVSS
jgi:hypothetical protein